jgi:hypothetical protein
VPILAILAVTTLTAQPAASASAAGQAVVISIPVLIIVVIFYLCRHRQHKISTAVLGFVAGVLLAGTTFGATLTNGTVTLITNTINAIGRLIT